MTLYQSYKANRYKKYFTGGPIEEQGVIDPNAPITTQPQATAPAGPGFAGPFQFGATLASGVLDATAVPDPVSGRVSTGTTVGKSALSGAAAGASLGPIGAGVGAVVGAGLGLLKANKEKKDARLAIRQRNDSQFRSDADRSAAMLSTNPSLIEGYKKSGYFAMGGYIDPPIDDPKKKKEVIPGPTYQTQAQLDAANTEAKRIAYLNNDAQASQVYVARKIGDPVVPYVDMNGQPVQPRSTGPKATSLPSGVGIDDVFPTSEGVYGYMDPQKGNFMAVDPGPVYSRYGRAVPKMANGGRLPLTSSYMNGGHAKQLASDTVEMVGRSHEQGGIDIPGAGAELEDGETMKGNYVFSDKLGFAEIHKKIAKARGIIEKKPATQERVNSMKMLKKREDDLMLTQEYFKQQRQIT